MATDAVAAPIVSDEPGVISHSGAPWECLAALLDAKKGADANRRGVALMRDLSKHLSLVHAYSQRKIATLCDADATTTDTERRIVSILPSARSSRDFAQAAKISERMRSFFDIMHVFSRRNTHYRVVPTCFSSSYSCLAEPCRCEACCANPRAQKSNICKCTMTAETASVHGKSRAIALCVVLFMHALRANATNIASHIHTLCRIAHQCVCRCSSTLGTSTNGALCPQKHVRFMSSTEVSDAVARANATRKRALSSPTAFTKAELLAAVTDLYIASAISQVGHAKFKSTTRQMRKNTGISHRQHSSNTLSDTLSAPNGETVTNTASTTVPASLIRHRRLPFNLTLPRTSRRQIHQTQTSSHQPIQRCIVKTYHRHAALVTGRNTARIRSLPATQRRVVEPSKNRKFLEPSKNFDAKVAEDPPFRQSENVSVHRRHIEAPLQKTRENEKTRKSPQTRALLRRALQDRTRARFDRIQQCYFPRSTPSSLFAAASSSKASPPLPSHKAYEGTRRRHYGALLSIIANFKETRTVARRRRNISHKSLHHDTVRPNTDALRHSSAADDDESEYARKNRELTLLLSWSNENDTRNVDASNGIDASSDSNDDSSSSTSSSDTTDSDSTDI